MSKFPPYARKSCFSKKRYPTEDFARKLVNKLKWERKVKLRYYFCDLCAGFHLTSKKKKENNA